MSDLQLIILKEKQVKQGYPGFEFQAQFPESSVLQHPSFAVKFYPRRHFRVFLLKQSELLVGFCLVSEYLNQAEIQFAPHVVASENMVFFVEKICSFYRARWYGHINICFPSVSKVDIYERVIAHISKIHTVTKLEKGNWSSLILNLKEVKEKIHAGYSENLRRNIKKALQLGLYVNQIQKGEEIKRLGIIFDKLYQWRKVKSQWHDSPTTFLAWYNEAALSKKVIWLGVYDSHDDLLGGIMIVNQGDTLFYQLGASDPEKRNLPVLHLCFHQAILYAKENDFSFFDFGGYDTEANENDQTNNINQFKRQFGGLLISSNPNILITLNKPVKIIMNFLISFRKHWIL
jgi:hypothetical protein